jgi:histidine triad (HIT) family protein
VPVLPDRGRRAAGRDRLSGRPGDGGPRHLSGHTQIVSRQHAPYFEDLPEATANQIIHVGQRLARAMKGLYGVPRVAFALTGGDHAHVHAHVVPMHEGTDITSRRYIVEEKLTFRSMPPATGEELAAAGAALRAALGAL